MVGVLAAVASTAATPEPEQQRPRPLPTRQDEDWSALKDERLGTAPLDEVKFVSLKDGSDMYFSLGGDARLAYELFIQEDYGRVPQDDSGALLFRASLHGSLRLGAPFRAFVQLKSTFQTGRDGGPTPIDVNHLDLHQGFAEVSVGDSRDVSQVSATLRLGRQELRYGVGRLIDTRNGPNNRLSFDAALLRIAAPQLVVDVFGALQVPVRDGVFDDAPGPDASRVWGVHLTTRRPWLAPFGFDAYYLGVARKDLVWHAPGPGDEVRHLVGARWWSDTGAFKHDVEITYAFGSFTPAAGNALAIDAWGLVATAAYRFDGPLRVEIGAGVGLATGDSDPSDGSLGTFSSPFPDLRFSGATTRMAPSNSVGGTFRVGLDPIPGVHLQAMGRLFWRAELADAMYSPIGFPLVATAEGGRFIGGGGSLLALWFMGPYTSLYGMVEVFIPGPYITTTDFSAFATVGANFTF